MTQQLVGVDSSAGAAALSAPAPWSAVAAIGVGAFALVTAEFLPVGLLPQIANDLAISEGRAGLVITIPGIVAACSAFLTISLARTFDRRHVLWVLLGLLVVSNVLVATANELYVLLLGRILLGIAVGGFWTIGVSLGPRLRPDAVGRATSIVFSGVTLGTVVGVPAGTLLGGAFGWRVAFAVSAVLGAMVVIALMLLLPSIRPERYSGVSQLPPVLRLPKVQVGLVAVVFIFTGQFAAYTYVTPYLNQISGIESGQLSLFLLGYGVAGIFGNVLCGWCVERDVRQAVLSTSLLLGCSMLLLVSMGQYPLVAGAAMVAWGLGFGMLPIAIQSWIFSAAPDRLETAAALFVSTGQLTMGAGALVGGLAIDRYGVVSPIWFGAVGALGGALWIWARFPQK
ncbi:MFS transporter [Pseudomonas sp. CCM 7891]|uniref:MFS transporter n=1 Tax=Pseudomonas karstica TaxID=1055468 RepID=A0A7X2RV24_9PSED|nr:MFS transporter [Pseudomonas karstica]MTD21541.1 MFS transporter [Pseudomonas karstica]